MNRTEHKRFALSRGVSSEEYDKLNEPKPPKDGGMKKIINGVRYDSDKAEVVGSASASGVGRSDFSWWEATLYVTPTSRRYFLAGEGGAMSRFRQPVGNNGFSGGSDLVPMTPEEALDWAETFLSVAEVEQHFADRITDA